MRLLLYVRRLFVAEKLSEKRNVQKDTNSLAVNAVSAKEQKNDRQENEQVENLQESQNLHVRECSNDQSDFAREENLNVTKQNNSILDCHIFKDIDILNIYLIWTNIYNNGFICSEEMIWGIDLEMLQMGYFEISNGNVYIKEPYLEQFLSIITMREL